MAILILENGLEKIANISTIKELQPNSKVILMFSSREIFEEKKQTENAKILEMLLAASIEKKIGFFPVPYCSAPRQIVERFNEKAIKIELKFYPEGAFLKPLAFWSGKIPSKKLLEFCKICKFRDGKCKGCFSFKNTENLNKIVEIALKELDKDDIVLDIGCGVGFYIKQLLQILRTPENLFLTDPKRSALEELKNSFQSYQKKPRIIASVCEYLPFRKDCFSLALLVNSFSHFFEPSRAILNIKKVLKRNGRVLLIENKTIENVSDGHGLDYDSHNGLNRIQIEKLFIENGFVRIYSKNAEPFYLLMFKKL